MTTISEIRREAAAAQASGTDHARISLPPVVTIIGVTAILYLGKDVLLPLAIALLLTFTLAPIVANNVLYTLDFKGRVTAWR